MNLQNFLRTLMEHPDVPDELKESATNFFNGLWSQDQIYLDLWDIANNLINQNPNKDDWPEAASNFFDYYGNELFQKMEYQEQLVEKAQEEARKNGKEL